MIYEKENTELRAAMEIINQEGLDGLSLAVEIILNEAMKIERSQHLKAIPYERVWAMRMVSSPNKSRAVWVS